MAIVQSYLRDYPTPQPKSRSGLSRMTWETHSFYKPVAMIKITYGIDIGVFV